MKGHKFKLEALLKIRRLKEDQCKMEIGRIQVQIANLEQKVSDHHQNIDQAYGSQEKVLEDGATGQELTFFPYMFEGNKASIERLQQEINVLKDKVSSLYLDLNKFRADVKVIEKMKEKDLLQYKKQREKKEFEILEEQIQNWKQILG